MTSWIREFRFAARRLRRQPVFTLVAVATLAVGIGANSALFSIVNAALRHPLPFPEPDRIAALWETNPELSRVTSTDYLDWRAATVDGSGGFASTPIFRDMAIFGSARAALTGDGDAEELLGARVGAGYFNVLGVAPLLGRGFSTEEDRPGGPKVVLLSESLWRGRFGGEATVLGRTLVLDGVPHTVVGVMPSRPYPSWPAVPARVRFDPAKSEYWIPAAIPSDGARRRSHVFGVVARLAPGIGLDAARAALGTLALRLEKAYPETNEGVGIAARPLADEMVGAVRPAMLALSGAVGLVLIIACVNVAGLLIARTSGRRREIAVHAALGAGRAGIARSLFVEGFVLAAAGGAAGLALAAVLLQVVLAAAPIEVLRITGAPLDGTALAVTMGLSILTTLLVSLAPALQASRPDLANDLKAGGRSPAAGDGRRRVRHLLVVAEVGLTVVLLVAAGLLAESFLKLQRVDPGFDPEGLAAAAFSLPASKYSTWEKVASYHEELLERARALPGVNAVALAYDQPLDSNWIDSIGIEGYTPAAAEDAPSARLHIVSAGYFRTLGAGILKGRSFLESDDPSHPGAAIVNEAFSRRWFQGGDPIGKRLVSSTPSFTWGDAMPRTFEIVGVAEDVAFLGLRGGTAPAFYLPARQFPLHDMTLLLRGPGDPAALAPELRSAMTSIDGDVPVGLFRAMSLVLADDVAQPRFTMLVMSLFGATSLLLAAIGLYGLLAQSVARRAPEIGVRMALGATPRNVVALLMREGLGLTLAGVALGTATSLAAGKAISGLLYGVTPSDPGTLMTAPAVLLAVASMAIAIPALRASRIDPATVLRGG